MLELIWYGNVKLRLKKFEALKIGTSEKDLMSLISKIFSKDGAASFEKSANHKSAGGESNFRKAP